VIDLHPVSYWAPWHVQYYAVKKSNSRKFMPFKATMFYLWVISVFMKRSCKDGEKQTGAISQKNIACLVLSDLDSLYWIKLFNRDKNFNDYFKSEDHPIRLYINTVL